MDQIFQDTKKKLDTLLKPYFSNQAEVDGFIKKCYKKKSTRKALLLTQWLTNIADNIEKVKPGRPPLKIVFLIILCESLEKILNSKIASSRNSFKNFFRVINQSDRITIQAGIKKSSINNGNLKFNTILDILYNLRNRVFHEGLYYDFHLNDNANDNEPTSTEGYIGRNKKTQRKIKLDIALSYNRLKGIIVKTALNNIKNKI